MAEGQAASAGLFEADEVTQLLRLLQEATRATPSGVDRYVPPSGGEIAEANYHHFIFGQRGSGKSSLLRHLEQQKKAEKKAAIWIDQEIFANLSYPDVLVSAVYELMLGVAEALALHLPEPRRRHWSRRLLGLSTGMKTPIAKLDNELKDSVYQLRKLKFAPLDRKVEWTVLNERATTQRASGGARLDVVEVSGESERTLRGATTSKELVDEGTKEQFLERALPIYRDLLTRAAQCTNGGFVFVDDLYQLVKSSQPLVLGYLHRLVKDTGLWLKIGSIRYSTVTFRPGDPPRGMQIGHDAQEVALDRGLRHFQTTQAFLEKILHSVSAPSEVDIDSLLTIDARKRLVLAAGGVARDYLRLTSGAITEARNRGVSAKTGSHRVIVEDVNKAAGVLAPSKLEDLSKDEPGQAAVLESLVRRLTEFCRQRRAAYFLVATDSELSQQVNALQHLRFTHLLFESETVPDQRSKRFNGWLLDVAELSAQRATTGMDFLGWENREKRRNRRLIFDDLTPEVRTGR